MKTGTVAIVGGESLIGRELRELINEQKLARSVKLIGVDTDAATLTSQGGEAAVITPLDETNLRDAQVTFLAGSPDSSRKAMELSRKSGRQAAFIDLTYATEEDPLARLRAPVTEPPGYAAPPGTLHVIAHPAAIAIALFLKRLAAKLRLLNATAHIFEPASERGQKGLDELEKQTVNLLSFRTLPTHVFDTQIGFAMLSSYGDEAPEALSSIELRIERHLATLLAGLSGVPMPSIRLIQAPVFHGYSISLHVEFEEPPDTDAVAAALASPEVDVRGSDVEPPTNVGIAGQGGIAVGSMARDRNNPRGLWFWVVADNFRLMAENATAVASPLLRAEQ
jgi:aspartate-semialdehyde dehydrogenase